MQKMLLKILWLAAWLLVTPALQAQQADCGFIQNPDRQAYCRAISGGGSSHCGFIREPDLQARCRAETGGGSSQCGFIRDTCKQRVGLVRIGVIPQTPAVLQANADLFKTPINKPIAEQLAEVAAANAALSASQICKPCAVQRQGVAQVNVDL